MKSLSWRIVVSLLVLLASIVYVLPSLPGVGGSSLGNLLPDARISLGLDLKGGMHLTLGVEVDKAVSNSLSLTGQELRGCSGIIIKHLFDFVNNRSYGSCAACISPEILRMNSSLFFQHIIKTPV